jgi:hypothetical protein
MKLPILVSFLLLSCGTANNNSASKNESATADNSLYMYTAESDLPECIEALQDKLAYIKTDSVFKLCDVSEWVTVDLRGKDGVDGKDGANGENGAANTIVSTVNCFSPLTQAEAAAQGINLVPVTGLYFRLYMAVMAGGDVFASGEQSSVSAGLTNSMIYTKGSNGAATGAILISNDWLGSMNGGYWMLWYEAATGKFHVDYNDTTTASFTLNTCTVTNINPQ